MSKTIRLGNGKGSKRRPGDEAAFRDNWDRIFNQPQEATERESSKDAEAASSTT